MIIISPIKALSLETGIGLCDCRIALELCKEYNVAKEYLRLINSAVSRKKYNNEDYGNFTENDYVELAIKNVKK